MEKTAKNLAFRQAVQELTRYQVDSFVKTSFSIRQGWRFERSEQGTEILYTVWCDLNKWKDSDSESVKRPLALLGVYRIYEWLDGSVRFGWEISSDSPVDLENIRKKFHMQTVETINHILAEQSALADQPMQYEKPKKKPGAHHKQDDIWAWKQIHESGREEDTVKAEWIEKIKNDQKRNLDYTSWNRQWRRIKDKSWLE